MKIKIIVFVESVPEHEMFFLYQDLVATTGVPDLPFAGGSHRPKNFKNLKRKKKKKVNYSYSHSHTHLLIHSLVLQKR